jgi:hypothetical protein
MGPIETILHETNRFISAKMISKPTSMEFNDHKLSERGLGEA